MKKLFFMSVLLLCATLFSQDSEILKIGGITVKKSSLTVQDEVIVLLFQKKYNRNPGSDDSILIQKMKFDFMAQKLSSLVYKIIMSELRHQLYDKVVTKDVIDEHMNKSKGRIAHDIKKSQAFLDAATFIRESKDENKYELAYKKYMDKDGFCTYNFFKGNIDKPHFIEFLKEKLKNRTENMLTEGDKTLLFQKMFPAFILQELTSKDEHAKQHLELSDLHGCGYKDSLIRKWIVEQGEKMGVEIYDTRYGNSLDAILRSDSNSL